MSEHSSGGKIESVRPALLGRRFVRFELRDPKVGSTTDTSLEDARTQVFHYLVSNVVPVCGVPPDIRPGQSLVRIESDVPGARTPTSPGWVGVTGHLQYTSRDERDDLGRQSTGPRLGVAVIIPICKSRAWWDMAHDERHAHFHPSVQSPGHTQIGRPFADRIFRRLYHARYLPGSVWDFLTYFEFAESDAESFRALTRQLRDPRTNPEWSYVTRETEIWLRPTS